MRAEVRLSLKRQLGIDGSFLNWDIIATGVPQFEVSKMDLNKGLRVEDATFSSSDGLERSTAVSFTTKIWTSTSNTNRDYCKIGWLAFEVNNVGRNIPTWSYDLPCQTQPIHSSRPNSKTRQTTLFKGFHLSTGASSIGVFDESEVRLIVKTTNSASMVPFLTGTSSTDCLIRSGKDGLGTFKDCVLRRHSTRRMDTERSTLSRYYKSGHRHYLCRIQTS
jgi:hypothetical protein